MTISLSVDRRRTMFLKSVFAKIIRLQAQLQENFRIVLLSKIMAGTTSKPFIDRQSVKIALRSFLSIDPNTERNMSYLGNTENILSYLQIEEILLPKFSFKHSVWTVKISKFYRRGYIALLSWIGLAF